MPSSKEVGGVHETVAERGVAASTVSENAGSAVLAWPSLTEIVMPDAVPTSAAVGVPERRPVELSKLAQAG